MSAADLGKRIPATTTFGYGDHPMGGLGARLKIDGPWRPWLLALAIYVALTILFFAVAGSERLDSHSAYNHYALQAEAWLHGRLDLGGPPPAYTGNNDFAYFAGKHFVSFPPFPALLIAPLVLIAGSVERVHDAQFFIALAGLGPSLLLLLLERLRRDDRSQLTVSQNAALALVFGLGTVYFFTAVQGTVWFAGQVVASVLLVGYMICSLETRHPFAAGVLLGLAVATRPTLGFALPWFCAELFRVARRAETASGAARGGPRRWGVDLSTIVRRGAPFATAASLILILLMWHNDARFNDPSEFGHRLLTVKWRHRIDTWGLFSPHYLATNLKVILGGLPFFAAERGLQINGHGLALWLTSPFYVWAFWPRRTTPIYWAAAASTLLIALPILLYQNTGWIQFGYRFSSDFAPFLFVMIAAGGRRLRSPFWALAGLAIAINGFGAATFDKAAYRHYYFIDGTQRIIHQWDLPAPRVKGLAPSRRGQ